MSTRSLLVMIAALLLPAAARAAELEKRELPSGKSYVTYRPNGLPEKPMLVLFLSHEHRSADKAAQWWKDNFSSIPARVIFPTAAAKGWRVYDWESQKIVKDAELRYLIECLDDAEKEFDI